MSNEKNLTDGSVEKSMIGFLGIESLPNDGDVIRARMPVTDRVAQPFGVMCGGASIALAEIVAGYGSYLLCQENEVPVGTNISANHVSVVDMKTEKFVYAYATCLHQGQSTHVWNVDIKTEAGKLVSTIRVTNFIKQVKPTETK